MSRDDAQTELSLRHVYVPASDGDKRTLLLLHGTGGDESSLLENGMPRFFCRLAEGVFDIDDLQRRTHELGDFVGATSSAYGFDPKPVIAVGYSNGANIAGATLLLRPQVLAGAALLHPMVPLVPGELPQLTGMPVFIGAGRRDPLIAPSETQRLATLLAASSSSTSWTRRSPSR
jgi:predicted esterase